MTIISRCRKINNYFYGALSKAVTHVNRLIVRFKLPL